jgi:hypothetical protein
MRLEVNGAADGRTERGAHSDEENRTLSFSRRTELFQLSTNSGVFAIRANQLT